MNRWEQSRFRRRHNETADLAVGVDGTESLRQSGSRHFECHSKAVRVERFDFGSQRCALDVCRECPSTEPTNPVSDSSGAVMVRTLPQSEYRRLIVSRFVPVAPVRIFQ